MWSQFFGKREKGEGFNETVVLLCWWNPPCKGWTFWSKGKNIFGGYGLFGFKSLGTLLVEKEKNEPKGWWFHQNRRPFKRSVGGQNRRPLQNPKPSPPGGWQNRRPFWGQHHHLVWVLFIFWSPIQGGFPCEKRTREETRKKLAYGPTTEFQSSANIYIYILHYMMSQHNNMQISL